MGELVICEEVRKLIDEFGVEGAANKIDGLLVDIPRLQASNQVKSDLLSFFTKVRNSLRDLPNNMR